MVRRMKLPRIDPTPQDVYLNRREFVKRMGLGAIALSAGFGCEAAAGPPMGVDAALRPGLDRADILKLYPATRSERFKLTAPLTDERIVATYNNFYEFDAADKGNVWKLAQQFEPDPWTVEVTGLCHKPRKFDIDALYKFPLEERTYHFRCVEAWSMDVPWTGFELNKLLKAVEPMSDAKFVRFTTVNRPAQMPGIKKQKWYPWPYFEALRMDEAMHELTLLCTGLYGKPLMRQNGAPFRIIVPWKYGYKSPKSIVKIELLDRQPKTFWETLQPREYPFLSNVEPQVPHPRWSQATERDIGTNRRIPTRLYNGYADYVAKLYA